MSIQKLIGHSSIYGQLNKKYTLLKKQLGLGVKITIKDEACEICLFPNEIFKTGVRKKIK